MPLTCHAPRSLCQDAIKLPCVREKLSRVNEAVQIASEGLSDEASASGGVLLMDNRVAHPISQVRGEGSQGIFVCVWVCGKRSACVTNWSYGRRTSLEIMNFLGRGSTFFLSSV